MATTEVAMPALSSTMKEGKIVAWNKAVGDKVEIGDVLMVVESDKADMDVEAFEEGYLAKILTQEVLNKTSLRHSFSCMPWI